MQLQWNDGNINHIARHNITPEEVEQLFENGPFDLELQNLNDEDRFTLVGETDHGRILVVVAMWAGDLLRPITAWDAPKSIKTDYIQHKGSPP
jgi:uncharacterized DUF497 family protein